MSAMNSAQNGASAIGTTLVKISRKRIQEQVSSTLRERQLTTAVTTTTKTEESGFAELSQKVATISVTTTASVMASATTLTGLPPTTSRSCKKTSAAKASLMRVQISELNTLARLSLITRPAMTLANQMACAQGLTLTTLICPRISYGTSENYLHLIVLS